MGKALSLIFTGIVVVGGIYLLTKNPATLSKDGFPINPKIGDTYKKGGNTYMFTTAGWIILVGPPDDLNAEQIAEIKDLTKQYDETLETQTASEFSRISLTELANKRVSINKKLDKYGIYLTYKLKSGDVFGEERDDFGPITPTSPVARLPKCCCACGLLWCRCCRANDCDNCSCSTNK